MPFSVSASSASFQRSLGRSAHSFFNPAKSALDTLNLKWITFAGLSATFPSLRALRLRNVTLPNDVAAFSKVFPNLSELSICTHGDVLLEGKVRVPSNLRFVVALAPQLVTLRLDNGAARGIPISFIKHLITIDVRLQRLDSSVISDYKAPTSPVPPPFVLADLPPLELRFVLHSEVRASVTNGFPPVPACGTIVGAF
jgi:hypothetical protein